VAGAELRGQPDAENGRDGADQNRPRKRPRRRRAQRWVADRNMGADDEHHQREADIREQLKRWVGIIDDTETGLADDEPRDQLTDDYRYPQARQGGQQRTGETYRGQQRQGVEAKRVHVSDPLAAARQSSQSARCHFGIGLHCAVNTA